MAVLEKEAPVDLQEQLIRRAWEDEQFAELLRTNPRRAIAEETGVELPAGVDIHVHQEDKTTLHLVIPVQLPGPREPLEHQQPTSGPNTVTAIGGIGCQCID